MIYLQEEVQRELNAAEAYRPRLEWDFSTGLLAIQFEARCLRDFLWLDLSKWMSGRASWWPSRRVYPACQGCGRRFRVGGKESRSDRAYCSNACRTRALRARQAEAYRLSLDGLSTKAIADRLESDEKTVARWIRIAAAARG